MSDIVERLKDGWDISLRIEASAEILRLRAENEKLLAALRESDQQFMRVDKERMRLRASLHARDGFIVDNGLWSEFTKQADKLTSAAAALKETKDE